MIGEVIVELAIVYVEVHVEFVDVAIFVLRIHELKSARIAAPDGDVAVVDLVIDDLIAVANRAIVQPGIEAMLALVCTVHDGGKRGGMPCTDYCSRFQSFLRACFV